MCIYDILAIFDQSWKKKKKKKERKKKIEKYFKSSCLRELKIKNLQKEIRSLEQFIGRVKGQNIF